MSCHAMRQGYQSRKLTKNGKRTIVFKKSEALFVYDPVLGSRYVEMSVRCNTCLGCRIDYTRDWSIRCMHEASLYEFGHGNSFITLTYNDESLPAFNSLDYRDFQLFMKRLRKKFSDGFYYKDKYVEPRQVRFFAAGEYGSKSLRPHYHAILFNVTFPDLVFHSNRSGHSLYTSAILSDLWARGKGSRRKTLGFVSVGRVTHASSAYVAGYMHKKVKGDDSKWRYRRLDARSGEFVDVSPEESRMSRKPGIAREWYAQYGNQVVRDDFVNFAGSMVRPPRYYDQLLQKIDESEYDRIKAARVDAFLESEHSHPDRIAAAAEISRQRFLERAQRGQIATAADVLFDVSRDVA